MSSPDQINDFLAAIEGLRDDDDAVRTTAHTSSVSTEGWPTAERSTDEADDSSAD